MQKHSKLIIYLLIAASISPFLFLLEKLNFDLYSIRPALFWNQAILILGSILGFVGVVLMFWQFTFGMRFIASLFYFDTVWLNKLHKKIGMYGVALVFFHPFLKALSYAGNLAYAIIPDFSDPSLVYVGYGRVAFFLLLILWITSAILRGKMKYRPWLFIHYLSYPIMFFVILHARVIGSYLTSTPWIATVWNLLTVWFAIVVIFRLGKFLGIGNYKYQLAEKAKVGEDIFVYRLKPLGGRIIPRAGQYCHIQVKPFGEAHPFTVMESDFSTGELVFGIKAQGKFTHALSELEPGARLSLDGPYGVFTVEGHDAEPKVLIAGGIGITPFVDLVRRFGNDQTYMFYANRFLNLAVRRDLFKQILDGRYYDVLDQEIAEGDNMLSGKITPEILTKTIPAKVFKAAEFFICGSKPFYNNYKNMLLGMNVPAGRIQYEEFGF